MGKKILTPKRLEAYLNYKIAQAVNIRDIQIPFSRERLAYNSRIISLEAVLDDFNAKSGLLFGDLAAKLLRFPQYRKTETVDSKELEA